jgi:hypothetical protein
VVTKEKVKEHDGPRPEEHHGKRAQAQTGYGLSNFEGALNTCSSCGWLDVVTKEKGKEHDGPPLEEHHGKRAQAQTGYGTSNFEGALNTCSSWVAWWCGDQGERKRAQWSHKRSCFQMAANSPFVADNNCEKASLTASI